LHIRATGKVSGKLEYSQIQIERGGEFRGEMQQVGAAPVYPSNSPSAMNQSKPVVTNVAVNVANPANKDAAT